MRQSSVLLVVIAFSLSYTLPSQSSHFGNVETFDQKGRKEYNFMWDKSAAQSQDNHMRSLFSSCSQFWRNSPADFSCIKDTTETFDTRYWKGTKYYRYFCESESTSARVTYGRVLADFPFQDKLGRFDSLKNVFLPLFDKDIDLQRACLEELHNAETILFGHQRS